MAEEAGPSNLIKRKKKSKFDDLFDFKVKDGIKYASCKICPAPGKDFKMSNNNTTGIRRHVKVVHKDECQKLDILNEIWAENQNETPLMSKPIDDDAIVDWVVSKYLPFNFFDDKETQAFFHRLNHSVSMPKSAQLRSLILSRFESKKNSLVDLIKKNDSKFAFTIDGWTSITGKSYYGMTIHYIDSDWEFHSFVLDFVPANGLHAGKDIAEIFYESLKSYGLEEKIVGLTVDNVSANTTFMEELAKINPNFNAKDMHFRCVAHILNLAAQDMMKSLNLAQDFNEDDSDVETDNESNETDDDDTNPVAKIRSVFLKLKRGEQLLIRFKDSCSAAGCDFLAPKIDCKTRWNSTYEMTRRALDLKPALNGFCAANGDLRKFQLTDNEWLLLDKVNKMLKNFKTLSENLGGEKYATLPSVVVSLNMLLDKLENSIAQMKKKPRLNDVEKKLISAYEDALQKLLKHYDKMSWVYCLVLVLDPRHKVSTFDLTSWGREMKSYSIEKFEEVYYTYQGTYNEESLSEEDEKDDDDEINFSSLYEKAPVSCPDSRKKELENYLALPRAPGNVDILAWWKANAHEFPTLAKMARDYLCICATSVPSERVFSKASLTIRKHRNRLNDESARMLLCLNSWVKAGSPPPF